MPTYTFYYRLALLSLRDKAPPTIPQVMNLEKIIVLRLGKYTKSQ